jgi:hypothetical protein
MLPDPPAAQVSARQHQRSLEARAGAELNLANGQIVGTGGFAQLGDRGLLFTI